MGRLIVVQFITLDGVVEDPDGSAGTAGGGWAMRYGPEGVAGDKFRLGPILQDGILLFGRRTWEHFSTLWPTRNDPFSQGMNAAAKVVVTHQDIDPGQWANSHRIPAPLPAWVTDTLQTHDIVVIGSGSVIPQLAVAGFIDEYRLLTFPVAVGTGRRLYPDGVRLTLTAAERVGPAVLSIYNTRSEAD
jgi:dihydrofolate reductase